MGDEVTNLLRKVAAAPRLMPPVPVMGGTRRFELGKRLGAGQFGEVFVARDREHGGAVALKALKSRDDEWVYRFKREFRHVADVSHPNVVRLYELFEEKGRWFLTMELVDGIAFDEHLARLPEQLEACFTQLASAIHALHAAGVLHRDVKPSNALVEATGRVVLLDFGLAYGLTSPEGQLVAGTPLFMAPEQWQAEGELSQVTDWYAFGAMLYLELARASPFEGAGDALLASKLRGPRPFAPPPGREVLSDLAMRLLRPKAAERPGYREIAAAFRVSSVVVRPPDRLPFVGRSAELLRMREAVAGGSDPVWINVTGEPGIGKTALARAFLEQARVEGRAVYEGRCHETESVPFKGLDGAVDALGDDLSQRERAPLAWLTPEDSDALVEMFPLLKRVGRFRAAPGADHRLLPHVRRVAAFGALRELLVKIGVERSVCLFIDDIQWAGEDTLELLLALLDPPPPGLVVLTTARDGSASVERFLGSIQRLGRVRCSTVPLEPLRREEVAELVGERASPALDGETAFRESGGHPYLLSRIVASRSGTLTADLRASIAALSSDARSLLEVISLDEEPLTQAAAFGAAGVDGFRADVVDELRRQRLARTSLVRPDALIEPYHAKVRETLLGTLSADELKRRHRALAYYLESNRRASPGSLAHHYQEAGSFDNARRWIRIAARDAVRGLAFLRADELYRQAAEISTGHARVEVRVEWADAMVLAGRRAHAATLCLDASAIAESEGRADEAADLRSRAGEHFILTGHFDRGIALLEAALVAAGVDFPRDNAQAMALTMQIAGEIFASGLDFAPRLESELGKHELRVLDLLLTAARALVFTDLRASYVSNLALREALRLGEPRRVQRALAHFVCGSSAGAPELPLFADAVSRASNLAEEQDDDTGRAWAVAADAIRLMAAGNVKDAWPLLRDSERRFCNLDPPMIHEAGGLRALILACAAVDGVDVAFAIRAVDVWLAEAAARDDAFVANWLRLVGSRVKLITGDPDASARQAAAASAMWAELDDHLFASTLIHVEMAQRLYTDPDHAHELGRELWKKLSGMFVSSAPIATAGFHVFLGSAIAAGAAAGHVGPGELAERLGEVISQLSNHNYNRPAIDGFRAHLAYFGGDREAAAGHMLRAVQGWTERGQELYAVSAKLRHAELVRDETAIEACVRELSLLGVGDPHRYATVLAGPAPEPAKRAKSEANGGPGGTEGPPRGGPLRPGGARL